MTSWEACRFCELVSAFDGLTEEQRAACVKDLLSMLHAEWTHGRPASLHDVSSCFWEWLRRNGALTNGRQTAVIASIANVRLRIEAAQDREKKS